MTTRNSGSPWVRLKLKHRDIGRKRDRQREVERERESEREGGRG